MSHSDFLAEFDADAHAAFAEAGMGAGTGTYTPAGVGAVAVPCRCYINEGLQRAGEYAPTFGVRITLDLLREDVPMPDVGGVVALEGESFLLESPDLSQADRSLVRWVVRRV